MRIKPPANTLNRRPPVKSATARRAVGNPRAFRRSTWRAMIFEKADGKGDALRRCRAGCAAATSIARPLAKPGEKGGERPHREPRRDHPIDAEAISTASRPRIAPAHRPTKKAEMATPNAAAESISSSLKLGAAIPTGAAVDIIEKHHRGRAARSAKNRRFAYPALLRPKALSPHGPRSTPPPGLVAAFHLRRSGARSRPCRFTTGEWPAR